MGEKSFCIGETSLEGIDVYKPAWILDIVQLGYLVGYKKYLVEAFSGFVSQVYLKLYSINKRNCITGHQDFLDCLCRGG